MKFGVDEATVEHASKGRDGTCDAYFASRAT